MSAGYVTVNAAAGRQLFYVLAESTSSSPSKDPLVLWLNGGPGCSSVGGGFLSELGPFFPRRNGTLARNPYAWNRVANVIFLDSPAFVGFSISNSSADRVVGDARTAADTRLFLLGFMKKHPTYAKRDLYITGESYAGHYIPNLAAAILDGNLQDLDAPPLHLKGIAIGNPWTDAGIDNWGAAFTWWSHSLISSSAYDLLGKACNYSLVGPIRSSFLSSHRSKTSSSASSYDSSSSSSSPADCETALDAAVGEMGTINIYQIYANVCGLGGGPRVSSIGIALAQHNRTSASRPPPLLGAEVARRLEARRLGSPQLHGIGADVDSSDGSGFPVEDACVDASASQWLNDAAVQAALHVFEHPRHWDVCTDLQYDELDVITSMIPVHAKLIAASLRILIYSGDVDGARSAPPP